MFLEKLILQVTVYGIFPMTTVLCFYISSSSSSSSLLVDFLLKTWRTVYICSGHPPVQDSEKGESVFKLIKLLY
jgi:hypothetical protein